MPIAMVYPQGGATATSTPIVYDVTGRSGATITDKNYEAGTSPASKVLEDCDTDGTSIRVHVEVHGPTDSWQPNATGDVVVSGGDAPANAGNWTRLGTGARRFAGYADIEIMAGGEKTITVTCWDGATTTVSVERLLDPPLVLTAVIDVHSTNTGGDPHCPYVQTQVSDDDTLDISGTTEVHATQVYVKDSDVTTGEGLQGPFAVVAGVWSGTINVGSGTDATSFYTCYATAGGTPGADFVSSESVDKDQTYPTFTGGAQSDITYPAGPPQQEALKGIEACEVSITHTNPAAGDTYLYDSAGTFEIFVSQPTSYADPKAGLYRIGGSYRETGTNFRLTVTRTEKNGRSASKNVTIKIANVYPAVTVAKNTGGTVLDRMGTDDGTDNYDDHAVYLISTQANLSTHTPVLTQDGSDPSTWQGAWSADGILRYTRSLRVADADIKTGGQAANNYTWASCSVINRAGLETTTIGTNPDYQLGGFAERLYTIAAWPNRTVDLGVYAVDTSKLGCENLSKGGEAPRGGTVFAFDNSPGQGSTPDDEADKFCIVDDSDKVDDDWHHWYNKDQANAISNSSGTAQVYVKETA